MTPALLRYDGIERRRARADHGGAERRVADPATEQDHPELYEHPRPDLDPASIGGQLALPLSE